MSRTKKDDRDKTTKQEEERKKPKPKKSSSVILWEKMLHRQGGESSSSSVRPTAGTAVAQWKQQAAQKEKQEVEKPTRDPNTPSLLRGRAATMWEIRLTQQQEEQQNRIIRLKKDRGVQRLSGTWKFDEKAFQVEQEREHNARMAAIKADRESSGSSLMAAAVGTGDAWAQKVKNEQERTERERLERIKSGRLETDTLAKEKAKEEWEKKMTCEKNEEIQRIEKLKRERGDLNVDIGKTKSKNWQETVIENEKREQENKEKEMQRRLASNRSPNASPEWEERRRKVEEIERKRIQVEEQRKRKQEEERKKKRPKKENETMRKKKEN